MIKTCYFMIIAFAVLLLPLLLSAADLQPSPQILFTEDNTQFPDFTDSYGVIFRDLNNDDLPDLYVVSFRGLNRLFINGGAEYDWLDFSIESGLGGNLMPRGRENLELGAASADVNNDGLPDMLIGGWGISTQIFLQEEAFYFQNIMDTSQISGAIDANGGAWADVNVDGNLDLFLFDEHYENRLLLGDGLGNFTDVSHDWGVDTNYISQNAAFADVDKDGYPDLYVCNWFAPDLFYKNINGTRFQLQDLPVFHIKNALNSNGVTFADLDNDADLDLLVTDRDRFNRLYQNDTDSLTGKWQFRDITGESGLMHIYPSYGSVIADFNNDGWQDIWINSVGPNTLFINLGQGKFEKVYEEPIENWHPKKHYSTGGAAADVDLDGDLDLFVANKDSNSVFYWNEINDQMFIQVRLEGIKSNRDAIGAKLWLFLEDDSTGDFLPVGYREVLGNSGYLSQNDLSVHFGLPVDTTYHIKIVFPGSEPNWIYNVQPGEILHVSEIENPARFLYLASAALARATGKMQFWINLLLFLAVLALLSGYSYLASERYRFSARQLSFFVSVTLVVLYIVLVGLDKYSLQFRLIWQIILLIAGFFFLSLLFEKLRKYEINREQRRTLLKEFSQKLVLFRENKALFETISGTIYDAMSVEYCAVYQLQAEQLIEVARKGKPELPDKFALNSDMTENRSADQIKVKISQLFKDYAGVNAFPIFANQKFFGVFCIAAKSRVKDFSQEDIEIFENLSTQLAIAIENNLYIEESQKLIQKITAAELREKYVSELEDKNTKLETLYRELQDTQTQLIQSEKMAGMGQLVAGVAHELNNPIAFIYANMNELRKYADGIKELLKLFYEQQNGKIDEAQFQLNFQKLNEKYDFHFIRTDLDNLIADSLEGSRRVKDVVQNLRKFSRLDEAELKEVDLHEGLDSTLLLLSNNIKNNISVHKNYGFIPKIFCHPGQINQVFMNILMNAIQAVSIPGNIWLTTVSDGETVQISIRDDGKGIKAADLNKIFDPFFTTKPVGEGTGLGLSISYKIIENHAGKIEVDSSPSKGTEFRIILPVIE